MCLTAGRKSTKEEETEDSEAAERHSGKLPSKSLLPRLLLRLLLSLATRHLHREHLLSFLS